MLCVCLFSSSLLLNRPRFSNIIDDTNTDTANGTNSSTENKDDNNSTSKSDTKLILLNESIHSEQQLQQQLPTEIQQYIQQHNIVTIPYALHISYDHYSTDSALRLLLPDSITVPNGFETCGHIAHLNLNEEQSKFKQVIGQVILEKNPTLRTVVNKTSVINNVFRVFPMEIIAGENDLITEVREHNCTFRFDYSKVYWNSRLSTEHFRIISLFQENQVIADMTCGIGPFAIPAVKNRKCKVFANDLNPESIHWLNENMKVNKINEKNLQTYNLDAKEFIKKLSVEQLEGKVPPFNHVVMNLPALSIDLLECFHNIYPSSSTSSHLQRLLSSLPIVHCLCFTKSSDPINDAVSRIETILNTKLPPLTKESYNPQQKQQNTATELKENQNNATNDKSTSKSKNQKPSLTPPVVLPSANTTHIHFIRNVSPAKDMICVSFYIPVEVVTGKCLKSNSDSSDSNNSNGIENENQNIENEKKRKKLGEEENELIQDTKKSRSEEEEK